MKTKNKKIAIGIAALLSITFWVMGFVFGIQPTTQQVQAEAVEMTVDTLGNLTWNEVDGAVGYKWSYAINGSDRFIDGGEALRNDANVASAMQAAVQEAKALNADADKNNDVTYASVAFTVTPVLYDGSDGETHEYVHKFREYVDYTYTTTDISEYMTTDSMTLPGQYTPITNAKFFKNDVFTFAMYADKTEANSALYRIAVGGEGTVGNNTANNYRLQLYANGSSGWRTYLKNETILDGAVLNSQTYYYFSYAVLDTYTISGASSIGETVYLKASTYNEETRSLETYHEIEKFYSTWDIQQAKASGYYFDWNEDGDKITISAYEAADRSVNYLSTGDEEKIVKNQLSEEVGFSMDEFNTLSWNESYYGATGYQWTYTVGDTTSEIFTTNTNSTNVLAALQAASVYAKENSLSKASVTFTVTPILRVGKAIPLTYDYSFTQYYGYSGSTTDVSEYMTTDTMTLPGYNTPLTNAKFFKNNVFTFALYTDISAAGELYRIGVGGAAGTSDNTKNNYRLQLYRNGSSGWRVYLSGEKILAGPALNAGTRYYFSFAVFDKYAVGDTSSIGETVYLKASTYNEETRKFETYHEIKQSYTTSEIQTAQAGGTYFGWNEDGDNITISTYTNSTQYYLSTGSLSKLLSAEAGLKVDAFNNLSWNEVDGAVGYKWTYTVGNAVSEAFMTKTNSVNVLQALQAAGTYASENSLSKATVTFTVTPILKAGKATQLVYDYSFTQYYGYNGETHDISEYMLVDRTSIASRPSNMKTMYYTKNSVFTFASRAELSAYGSGIYQLDIGGRGQNKTNYYIRLWASGAQWRVWMGNNGVKDMSHPVAIPLNQDHYFSIAVFDTYDLSGNVTGETLYIRQSIYDETLGKLVTVTESTKFYTTEELQAQSEFHKWNSSTDENGQTVYSAPFTIGMYNNDPNATYADGTTKGNGTNRTYLFTGDPNYVATPEYDREANGLTFTNKDFYEIGTLNSTPNTIEVELKVPEKFSTTTTTAGAVFSNAVGGYGLTLEVYEYGKPSVTFYATDGNKYRVLFDGINVATGYWMHLTITHDEANNVINAYVNGEFAQAGSVVLASDLSAANAGYFDYAEGVFEAPFFLGSDYYQERNACFQGSVRSLAVYSDVRTADEILQDYEDGVAVADNELLVAYETPNTLAWEDISDLSVNGQTMNYYHWEDLFFTEKEAVTDYEYSFAIVGDPQIITNNDDLKGTKNLDRLYDWIIDNKESKNIQYVFTLGDIVNYNNVGSWTIAKAAISQLDGVLPYSIIRGNHDGSDYINQYFYYDAYTNQFNGFYEENKLENAWRTFTVADTDYLILNLDYQPKAAVLEWAADIVEAFPDHKVIISTHYYLTSRGNLSASGQLIWDTLASKYGNIFLVMGGHVTAQRPIVRQDKGVHGNTVTQMLIDPQCWDSSVEETGMVVMLYFKNDGTIEVEEYSTLKQAYFREDNQFPITELSPVYTAHNFGDWVQNGNEQTRTCEDCGHTETEAVPETNESKVKAFTLTLDGTIGVNFYVSLASEVQENIANAKLKIVCNGNEQILDFPQAQVGGWSDGLYKFTYHVAAKDIDTTITVQLMVNGELIGEETSYTVRDYIQSVLADTSGTYAEKHKALVTALQDYCEAAAVCHNVENAVITDSSRINAVDNAVFDTYGASVEGENAPKIAISLLTEATTTIRVYVMGAEAPTITVNGTELTVTAGDGYYYADLTGIDGFSLAAPQTFVVNATVTVTCSAISYGKYMDTTDTNLMNVMKALYLYNQAATAYAEQ